MNASELREWLALIGALLVLPGLGLLGYLLRDLRAEMRTGHTQLRLDTETVRLLVVQQNGRLHTMEQWKDDHEKQDDGWHDESFAQQDILRGEVERVRDNIHALRNETTNLIIQARLGRRPKREDDE